MGKRNLGIILIISMIMTSLPWTYICYASDDILIGTYETQPADQLDQVDTGNSRDDVVSETYRTEPVANSEEDSEKDTPNGVVSMTLKTTAVDNNDDSGSKEETALEEEVTGRSSLPDPAELGIYSEDVINMVMPVVSDDTYDFVFDSQDLLSRFSIYKDSYKKSSIYFTNTGDEITHSGISDVAMARNKSSVPVLLYVTLQVENEYGWPVRYTDMESVEDDEEKNLSFAIIPVSANGIKDGSEDTEVSDEEMIEETEPIEDDIKEETAESEVAEESIENPTEDPIEEPTEDPKKDYIFLDDQKICVDENGKAEMILYLDGSKDNFDVIGDKYMAKEDAVWSDLGFAITGACNTKADWYEMDDRSMAGENLIIHVSYRMDTLTEEQQAQIEEGLRPDPVSGIIRFE